MNTASGCCPAACASWSITAIRWWSRPSAGAGIGFDDARLSSVPARASPDAPPRCSPPPRLIVKVKEPQPQEIARLQPGQVLFTYLHLAADRRRPRG